MNSMNEKYSKVVSMKNYILNHQKIISNTYRFRIQDLESKLCNSEKQKGKLVKISKEMQEHIQILENS